jgi:hypothetical protein
MNGTIRAPGVPSKVGSPAREGMPVPRKCSEDRQECIIGTRAAATRGSLRSSAGFQTKPCLRRAKKTMKDSMIVTERPAQPAAGVIVQCTK